MSYPAAAAAAERSRGNPPLFWPAMRMPGIPHFAAGAQPHGAPRLGWATFLQPRMLPSYVCAVPVSALHGLSNEFADAGAYNQDFALTRAMDASRAAPDPIIGAWNTRLVAKAPRVAAAVCRSVSARESLAAPSLRAPLHPCSEQDAGCALLGAGHRGARRSAREVAAHMRSIGTVLRQSSSSEGGQGSPRDATAAAAQTQRRNARPADVTPESLQQSLEQGALLTIMAKRLQPHSQPELCVVAKQLQPDPAGWRICTASPPGRNAVAAGLPRKGSPAPSHQGAEHARSGSRLRTCTAVASPTVQVNCWQQPREAGCVPRMEGEVSAAFAHRHSRQRVPTAPPKQAPAPEIRRCRKTHWGEADRSKEADSKAFARLQAHLQARQSIAADSQAFARLQVHLQARQSDAEAQPQEGVVRRL